MIMPMKKITLVVLSRERDEALAALRSTGVLHIEKREAFSQRITDAHALLSRLDQAASVLFEKKISKKAVRVASLSREKTIELVDRVLASRDEYRATQERMMHLGNELDRMAPWGKVCPSDFTFLAEKGIFLHPFEMSTADFMSLPETVRTFTIRSDKKTIRLLVLSEKSELPEGIPSEAKAVELPILSTDEMQKALEYNRLLLSEIEKRLASDALCADAILFLKGGLLKELEFDIISTGMPLILIGDESAFMGKTSLCWLTGFVPSHEEIAIGKAAVTHGWAFISEEPGDEDNVPTQIKNNRFVNLISPLLDFLGTVPGYRELDISLWFLLFFGIFFAMIFGDGGYGSLLVLVAAVNIISAIRKKKSVATALYMLLYLSLMTVAWGAATCSWFGLPLDKLPQFFKSIAIPAFSSENPDAATNIKVFCFVLGLVQLSLAHVIGIIRNIKTFKVLGELGSLLMTVGMFFVVLNLVIDAEKYPMTNIVLGTIGAGFLLNFVFINYSGSIVGSIIESLKNIITMFLGVVNVFGDIMSYIRLWAVGLAGAAISSTVNSMAGDFMGGVVIFAGLILLLFGHGLNFMMNILSVIVHGVRLNTLEFSNHLGLTWSGFKYEPFSETVKK